MLYSISMDKVRRDGCTDLRLTALAKAVRILGGPSKTAKLLKFTPQFMDQLLKDKRRTPVDRCVELENLTNRKVTVEQLRPDLFSKRNKKR